MVKMVLSTGIGVDDKIVRVYKETEISALLSCVSNLVTKFQDYAKVYLNEGTIYSLHLDVSVFNTWENGDFF